MASLAALLAWRYLSFSGKDRTISFMIRLCFLGIFIGSFALMLTLIITSGFEKAVHEKMQGINAQCVLYAPGQRIAYEAVCRTVEQKFPHVVAGVSGSSTKQVIIDDPQHEGVIMLRGIDPARDHSVSSIVDKIIAYDPSLTAGNQKIPRDKLLQLLLDGDGVIVGHKLAAEHGWEPGDQVSMLLPEPRSKKNIKLKPTTVTIAGVFKVGLEEYDNNVGFCSLALLHTFFEEEGVEQMSINLHSELHAALLARGQSPAATSWWQKAQHAWLRFTLKIKRLFAPCSFESEVMDRIKQIAPELEIKSWQELYPALVASLKLEKYVMFFVIALITLVASLNMISLLFMQIQQKRRDIAIFKAMGMPGGIIRGIFLRIGLCITVMASTLGLTLAAAVGWWLEQHPFIQLPDVYYISYLPAHVDGEIFVVVFLATLLIGFIATWFPAQRVGKIRVVQILREE